MYSEDSTDPRNVQLVANAMFDNLFKTPEKRRAAVQAVRKLMPAYDNIEASPDLSAYGTEGTTEAHQYYLLDENKTSYCPYNDLNA